MSDNLLPLSSLLLSSWMQVEVLSQCKLDTSHLWVTSQNAPFLQESSFVSLILSSATNCPILSPNICIDSGRDLTASNGGRRVTRRVARCNRSSSAYGPLWIHTSYDLGERAQGEPENRGLGSGIHVGQNHPLPIPFPLLRTFSPLNSLFLFACI